MWALQPEDPTRRIQTLSKEGGNSSEKGKIQEILKKEVHSFQTGLNTSLEMQCSSCECRRSEGFFVMFRIPKSND